MNVLPLTQGYPGKSTEHGGLGWSSVTLVRHGERLLLADTGSFGMRSLLAARLAAHGVDPAEVTDVLLTHAHYDHAANYLLFPSAAVWIGAAELDWAAGRQAAFDPLPELYAADLASNPRTRRVARDGEILPGVDAFVAPGHTPGSVVYRVRGADGTVLFSGDAAKNRAELLGGDVDMTLDRDASQASVRKILDLWREYPDTLLVPGHDVPMRWTPSGPEYVGKRLAGIRSWFGEDLATTTHFDLTDPEGDR
ncbi:MBL fold metallo-hydrolase [Saccharopolyspora sp. 5N708]|uniref:MBL fold metallo-hydrolase n=1 Tax=Saccharopolyspora sp. 5N708 TaxID=3457424 RepID=UPI003FD0CD9B